MKSELFCLTQSLNFDNHFRRFTRDTADRSAGAWLWRNFCAGWDK